MESHRSRRWLLLPALFLAVPWAIGASLRFFNIKSQVIGGDELHILRAALLMPLGEALTTYKPSDNCIPLSSLYRFMLDCGVQLTEMHLRSPILLFGLALLIAAPLWVRRSFDPSTSLVYAFLLSVSPLLIHYSVLVRSYLPIVVLGFIAIISFERWMRTGDSRWGFIYAVTAALTSWFHLVAVPFVFSPFAFFAIAKLTTIRAELPSWRRGLQLALASGLLVLVFLVPAHKSLLELVAIRHTSLNLSWASWSGVSVLMAGSAYRPVVIGFWLLAALGLVRLCLRHPFWGLYSVTPIVGQIVGLLILSPHAMNQPEIFARYLIVALPLVLFWVAYGLTAAGELKRAKWRTPLVTVVSSSAIVALVVSGPLPNREFGSPFLYRPERVRFFLQSPEIQRTVPEGYLTFLDFVEGPVAEYPWHTTWRYSDFIVQPQKTHGREVVVCPAEKVLWDERLAFRNMVIPEASSVLNSRSSYFVLHLDPLQESQALQGRPPMKGSLRSRDTLNKARELTAFAAQSSHRSKGFLWSWGEPDYRDDLLMIWNLDRVREDLNDS